MGGPGLNWRFIAKILGMTLVMESFFILIASGVSLIYSESDFKYLLISAGLCLFFGVLLVLSGNLAEKSEIVGKRESFFTVTMSWILFSSFGSIPFFISGSIPSFTDAFFETMSGFTTTGATILNDVESLPLGLMFWRCMTQWLGGLGVIVFSLVLLPLYGDEVSQLFDAETTGLTRDRFRPRVVEVAKRIWSIYMGFTLILILLLFLGPMDLYDAVCHAMTTISTGGYSTKQSSIAYWGSTYLETVMVIFMIIGAINFSIYYFLLKKNFKRVLKDEEIHWFLGIITTATLIVMIGLLVINPEMRSLESFRTSLFQVVSLVTTTGFSTQDYVPWGPFFWIILLILMLICGCAGSTSGGLKVVRIVVLVKNVLNEFGRLIHPRAVIPVRLNGNAVSMDVVQRLLAFVFLYVVIIVFGATVLLFSGVGFDEAIGAAVTSIGNVGPGLGSHGPSGSFSQLTDFAKWLLSFLMLVGRLELFTVLILFTPGFWKK